MEENDINSEIGILFAQKGLSYVRSCSYSTLREYLRFLRQTPMRNPQLVVASGKRLLDEGYRTLELKEVWDIHEQIFIASLDIGDKTIANDFLNRIQSQFGNESMRVQKLNAMFHEFEGQHEAADQIYRSILEKDPTNSIIMKRQIAIRKARGDISTAIRLLNDYLKLFMADVEAWLELAELYIDQQLYKNAAFCYEDVILANPHNHHFLIKYAEILYTLGGIDNLRLAKKYFAYALEICNFNIKALYGLCMSIIAIGVIMKQGKHEKETNKENLELFVWAYSQLESQYKENRMQSYLPLLQILLNKSKDL